jgi:UDP-3-O-[3-hydroxymyristoyl] glucosamine N-acyltransferase
MDATPPSFFNNASSMTVAEIASLTGATPRGGAELSRRINNIAPIDRAGPEDLTFLENAKFFGDLAATKAGAVLTTEHFARQAPAGITILHTPKPYDAFVEVARKFFAGALRPVSVFDTVGVAPGASVHPLAHIDSGVTVDPGAVIGPHAEIGTGTLIGANAVIGPNVRIGRDCAIGPGCTITHAHIGDRVIVHPGCHIGQDGFGYVPGAKGHIKIPQIGSVIIHNDVEIGSGTRVDRGGMRDTVIGEGTKIDNLCQIGHNVVIGRRCIVVANSGLSGSVTLEDFVMLGGSVGVGPHVTIGKGAQIAGGSGVIGDVPAGEAWGGYPARPRRQWLRQEATLSRLAESKKRDG